MPIAEHSSVIRHGCLFVCDQSWMFPQGQQSRGSNQGKLFYFLYFWIDFRTQRANVSTQIFINCVTMWQSKIKPMPLSSEMLFHLLCEIPLYTYRSSVLSIYCQQAWWVLHLFSPKLHNKQIIGSIFLQLAFWTTDSY